MSAFVKADAFRQLSLQLEAANLRIAELAGALAAANLRIAESASLYADAAAPESLVTETEKAPAKDAEPKKAPAKGKEKP